ncbi:MAG: NOP5/NOP56 family protein [archaeon]
MDLQKLREKNLLLTRDKIRESVSEDNYIIHAISNIEELAKVANAMTKRLRWWYALYLPEFSKNVSDNETFVRLVLSKKKKEILQELKLKKTMGKELSTRDLKPIMELAMRIESIYKLRDYLRDYLEEVISSYCKNMYAVGGSLIVAKLINAAGSLRRLAMMPSSTIQLLGAEKALFRHLKTGSRPPKHGIVLQHPLVSSAKKLHRGKYSRMLADKLSIAAKTDYFKGKFIGNRLRQELEEKLK